jgi:HlyD family secretion protein
MITALGVTAACMASTQPSRSAEATPDMSVSVSATQRSCFTDAVQLTGVVVPRNEILVRPDREGLQISQVLVEAGDSVIAGQVLARLNAPDGQAGAASVAVQAPAAGTIISKHTPIGSLASAKAEPLFRIAGRGEMELLAETPAKTVSVIGVDQSAQVAVVGLSELPGRVRVVSTAVNPTTQLAQVRIFIGGDPRLRAGTFGMAKIDVNKRCAPAVPLSAILYSSEGAVVQIVRENRVETRPVTVGLISDGQAEIRSGLSIGEIVVARAGSFVREGDSVKTIPINDSRQQ